MRNRIRTAVIVLSAVALAFTLRTTPTLAGTTTPCRGGVEVAGPGPVTYCAPQGNIVYVCIKAGTGVWGMNADGQVGCYYITGIGTSCVTVTNLKGGPDCKDISHVRFFAK